MSQNVSREYFLRCGPTTVPLLCLHTETDAVGIGDRGAHQVTLGKLSSKLCLWDKDEVLFHIGHFY